MQKARWTALLCVYAIMCSPGVLHGKTLEEDRFGVPESIRPVSERKHLQPEKEFSNFLHVPPHLVQLEGKQKFSHDAQKQITLYITDFGINQWNDQLKMGADFSKAENNVFKEFPSSAQILVPMPSDKDYDRMSMTQLTGMIRDSVKTQLDKGLAQGLDVFELQIVQNINTTGYINKERQDKVNEFGAAVYKAIEMVDNDLHAEGVNVLNYAIVGSNGTKVLTENVASWRSYLKGIDFFDGRAFWTPTVKAIETIGQENVRFFNTFGDIPAPYTVFGIRSIGSFDTVKDLKKQFSEIKSYLLLPMDSTNELFPGHIAGMKDPGAEFLIQEYLGQERFRIPEPGFLKGRNFRPNQKISEISADYYVINKDAAKLCLETASTLEDVINYIDKTANLTITSNIKDLYGFVDALQQDVAMSRENKFAILRSHTLEQIGNFGLGKLPTVVDALKKSGKLPSSFNLPATFGAEDIATAVGKHVGSGRADIDTITNYLDGANKASWAVVGYLQAGPEGARLYQSVAGTGAKLLREATLPIFKRAVLIKRNQGLELVKQWRTLQERRIYDGLTVQPISEVYGGELLRENGLNNSDIDQMDRTASDLNQSLIEMQKDFSAESIQTFAQTKKRNLVESILILIPYIPVREVKK